MFLEFCNYNKTYADTQKEQIAEVFSAIDANFDGIAVSLNVLRQISDLLRDIPISISTTTDFPQGRADKKLRMHETIIGLKSGANKIDLVANPFLIDDARFYDFCKDIKSHKRACDDYGADLRVIINHNLYSLRKNISIARMVEDAGALFIIPAAGFHNDDIYDNILTCNAIESHTSIKTVCNGYIWLEKQYLAAINADIFGLRLYNLHRF